MDKPTVTTIDIAGRLVVPKEIRDKAQLAPGTRLSVRYVDGHVEIEPEPRAVRIVRKGRLHVAVALEEDAPLRAESVRRTAAEIRTRGKRH